MSVTVNDHRKYVEGKEVEHAAKQQEAHAAPLLEQVASAYATTGNDDMDKLVRGIQALIEKIEANKLEIAAKGMGAVPNDMMKLCQMQYMFESGKAAALAEVIKIPAQIVLESRPAPSGLHSV